MITVLKQIRYHNNEQLCKVDTLYCMLQVIEVLEKNFLVDDSMNSNEWNIVSKWLDKYYCQYCNGWHISSRAYYKF